MVTAIFISLMHLATIYVIRCWTCLMDVALEGWNLYVEQSLRASDSLASLIHLQSLSRHISCKNALYRVHQNKMPQYETTISQKCMNIFAPNFAYLFNTQLSTSLMFMLYLLDVCRNDGNFKLKNEFCN